MPRPSGREAPRGGPVTDLWTAPDAVDPDDHGAPVTTHRGYAACPHRDFMIIAGQESEGGAALHRLRAAVRPASPAGRAARRPPARRRPARARRARRDRARPR